jgi:hypothetical protein
LLLRQTASISRSSDKRRCLEIEVFCRRGFLLGAQSAASIAGLKASSGTGPHAGFEHDSAHPRLEAKGSSLEIPPEASLRRRPPKQ